MNNLFIYFALVAVALAASPPAGSINVASYGAKGDGSDATTAIKNAIAASTTTNQVIWFPTGTYTISSTITIQPSRQYLGDVGSVLHATTQNLIIFQANSGASSGLTFNGLTFDNGQVTIYSTNAYADKFTMTNCIFQNNTNNCLGQSGCPAPHGLFFPDGNGPSNAIISYNTFQNMQSYWTDIDSSDDDGASCAVGMYGGINVTISHNKFDLMEEGIKVYETTSLYCQNFKITDNYFTRIHRMGIETQCATGSGWLYQNNFMEDFNAPFWNTFGISARSDADYNVSLIGNTILMLGVPTGWYGNSLEVNGNGLVTIYDNYIYGPQTGTLVYCVQSTGYLNVTNNNVCSTTSLAQVIATEYGSGCLTNPKTVVSPNYWTSCTSDTSIPTNYPPRPVAGAYSSQPTPAPTPKPTPKPTPAPTPKPTAAPTCPAPVIGTGSGLRGDYYSGTNFFAAEGVRKDPVINFSWTTGPGISAIPATGFSVRWSGTVLAEYSGVYTFYTTSDDGARLTVNSVEIINNWSDHAAIENSGTISLVAGQSYPIVLEYYQDTGAATISLSWSAACLAKEIIPTSQLSPLAFSIC